MLVVNFFGGPGAGKSTLAANVFSELKYNYVEAELVPEYAKQLVWSGRNDLLSNQKLVFDAQFHSIIHLQGKIDVAVVDSPLPLSVIYDPSQDKELKRVILDSFHYFDNLNYFVGRTESYSKVGRIHDEDQALAIDDNIVTLLLHEKIPFLPIPYNRESVSVVVEDIMEILE